MLKIIAVVDMSLHFLFFKVDEPVLFVLYGRISFPKLQSFCTPLRTFWCLELRYRTPIPTLICAECYQRLAPVFLSFQTFFFSDQNKARFSMWRSLLHRRLRFGLRTRDHFLFCLRTAFHLQLISSQQLLSFPIFVLFQSNHILPGSS